MSDVLGTEIAVEPSRRDVYYGPIRHRATIYPGVPTMYHAIIQHPGVQAGQYNLRSIKAIGFDMDYTLIHYRNREWEGRAYVHLQQRLAAMRWPVDSRSSRMNFRIRSPRSSVT